MAFEISVLAALGALACWGLGDFFIQRAARKTGDVQALGFLGGIAIVLLFPFVLPELMQGLSLETVGFLIFVGLLTFIAAMLDFEALKQGKLSVVEGVFEIEFPVTVLFGIVFFREILSSLQLGLIVLVLVSITFLSLRELTHAHYAQRFERGIWFALAASVLMATLSFFTAVGAREISPLLIIWFPAVVYTLLCLSVLVVKKKLHFVVANARAAPLTIFGMGFFDTLAWVLFAIALAGHELAIIAAIAQAYPAITLFLGLVINKETISRHQLLAAVLAVIASVSLAFTA